MTGPGNVICFNRVTGFRDCISTMEETQVTDQFCIDIYNNDIYTGADDGIEADFCFHNCRIMRSSYQLLCRPELPARHGRTDILHSQCDVQLDI